MVVLAERTSSSFTTIAEHMKMRTQRNQISIADPDPAPETPPTRWKSTISSLLLSTNESKKKTNNFTQSTFRGLGCTAAASQHVSVPAAIRTSADWETKKVKKKSKQERKKKKGSKFGSEYIKSSQGLLLGESNNGLSSGVIQDVWCGPGIGFSADAVGSVDCVVARRNVHGRGKIDGDKINHRERPCLPRRAVKFETCPVLDTDHPFISTRKELDFFGTGTRYHRHVRHPSPEGFAEIMMLQNSLLMGGRVDSSDRFSDWRLDIEDMTYEELLELGDRMGYVNTGLQEDEIGRCLRKIRNSVRDDLPSKPMHVDRKCSICQEEYEADDEMAKLKCGHSFHVQCIKQWLAQKNCCPVCKTAAVA